MKARIVGRVDGRPVWLAYALDDGTEARVRYDSRRPNRYRCDACGPADNDHACSHITAAATAARKQRQAERDVRQGHRAVPPPRPPMSTAGEGSVWSGDQMASMDPQSVRGD